MNQLTRQPFRPRPLLALLLLGLLLGACGRRSRSIHPVIPTPDPGAGGALVLGQPILVSFTALNDDASANLTETQFRNQLVRVTGAFVPSEPLRCGGEPRNGPVTTWALVAENLRLEVSGLAEVVELVPEGTQMTVEGYWRVYEGPVGCGKEPPSALRFYLDARQIIAPNPLPIIAGAVGESLEVPSGEGNGGTEGPGSGGIGTPAPPETPSPGTFGPTGTPGGRATASVTPTRIGDDLTPTITATTTPSATPTLTATSGPSPTPSRTGTPSRTPTVGPSPTPSPTSTPLGQATPGPTSTGNPYPLPTPSSTASPTPGY